MRIIGPWIDEQVSSPFALCAEAHNPDGNVWAVKWPLGDIDDGLDWQLAPAVTVIAATTTAYRGPDAPQPRWFLVGHAFHVVRADDGSLTIHGATIS